MNLKQKFLLETKKMAFYNHTTVNSWRNYNNDKHVCTYQETPKYIKQKLKIEGKICNSTIIVGDFKTSLSIMDIRDRKSTKK